MSLSSAMSVGISGLTINAEAISVVGNNIANVNTVGFKEGRTLFADMLSATLSTGQVGRGGVIQAIQNNFSQGSFENTNGAYDLAIQGDSFFVLQDNTGAQTFSRAGAFDYNNSEILTNANGQKVVGYGINQATGESNGITGAIDKSVFSSIPATATTAASVTMNLDSTQTIPGITQTSSISLNGNFGAATAPASSTATQVFDEFGLPHTVAVNWGGTSPDYTYSVTISGTQAGTPGSADSPITGTLRFPTITNPPTQSLTFTNGAKSQPLTLVFSNLQNSGTAVIPSAVQNGSAGQQSGTVMVSGGMNAAGISSATSQTGSYALTPGVTATVSGATTSKNSASLAAVGSLNGYNATSATNTATLANGSYQMLVLNTTGLMVGMDITDESAPDITESAVVTWKDFLAAGTQTVGGMTITAIGPATAAQVATAANTGVAAGNISAVGSPAGWNVAAGTLPNDSIFTSTTSNTNVTDVLIGTATGTSLPATAVTRPGGIANAAPTAVTTAGGVAKAAPTASSTQGATNLAPPAAVTTTGVTGNQAVADVFWKAFTGPGAQTVGGMVITSVIGAGTGAFSAPEVAQVAFDGITITHAAGETLTRTTPVAGWAVTAPAGYAAAGKSVFTSTTNAVVTPVIVAATGTATNTTTTVTTPGVADVTESAVVTWQPFLGAGTQTVDDMTITATGAFSAAQVAQVAATNGVGVTPVPGLTVSTPTANWTVAAAVGTTNVFTSTTPNAPVPNIDLVPFSATGGVTESAVVTWKSFTGAGTQTIGGMVITADGTATYPVTAAQVAQVASDSASVTGVTITTSPTLWTVAANPVQITAGQTVFTSTTPNLPVADVNSGLNVGAAISTETALVTWKPFVGAGTQTVGGMTITATGAFTAAEVAQVAGGGAAIAGLTITAPVVGWTVATGVGATNVFTSTTVATDVVPNIVIGVPTGVSTESALVTWKPFTGAGTQTVGGMTITSTGAFTASQVAQVAGGGSAITGLTVTTQPTGWTVAAGVGATNVFTSTTAGQNVTNIAVGTPTGPAASAVTTQGQARRIQPDTTILSIDTQNKIVTLSKPAAGDSITGIGDTMTYKSNVITKGTPDKITGVNTNGLTVGMAVIDDTNRSTTESAVVTWQPFVAAGSQTIGGMTITATGAFTGAQVAQIAGGAAITGLLVTAQPTDWEVAPAVGSTNVFTSKTPNLDIVPNIVIGAATGTSLPATAVTTQFAPNLAASAVTTPGGTGGSTETAVVTWTGFAAAGTQTVDDMVIAATGAFTAAQVAQVAATNGVGATPVPGLTVFTPSANWTIAAPVGVTNVFTSTTPTTNVANIDAVPFSFTGIGNAASSAVTTPGVANSTETATVTWAPFLGAGTQVVDDMVITSDGLVGAGVYTANQVAQVAAGAVIAGLTSTGSTKWSVGAAVGTTNVFTDLTAPGTNVANIDFVPFSATGGSTETAVVTWQPFLGAGTQTVGGVVVTATGAFTAAQVAQVAGGGAGIAGLSVTNVPALWTVGGSIGATNVFTSTTLNAPAVDIVIGVPTGPTGSASVTDGKLGNIITGPPTYITAIDTATNTVTLNTSNKVISSAGDNLIFATNVVTLGSNTVRAVDTTGLYSGMAVSGTGIPANTTISFIDSINKTITLSKNAIGNSYGTNLDLKTNVITSGSNSITGADTTGLIVGMAVTDSTDGTALGTITGIDAATHTIALSANAGAGSIGHKLTFDNNIITNASSTISGVDTSNVKVGMVITGVAATGQPGIIIPPGTVVSAISGSSIILSNPVAVSGGATSNAAQLSFGNDTTKQGDTTIYGVDVSNVKVGMIVSGNGIPVGSVVTALDANAKTVTISKPALASAVGVSLTFGSNNTTANSNVVTGVNTDAIAVGAAVSGAGIPANTTVTAIDSVNKTVTLSSQATATASGVSLTFGGAGFQFTDNTGSIRSGTLVVNNGKWTATVAGASNPITGTVTNGATGTTWSQDNSSVNIGGVNQTVKFDFGGSSASNTAVTVTANGFNSSDPSATSNFSNSFVAYDAQGNTHNVNIYYRKISANSWDYHAMIPDATGINGMAGNNVINGSLTFDDTGILTSQSPPATTVNTIKFSGGVPDMSLSLDLGQGKSTQVAFQSQASQTADGNGKGSLLSTTIDEKGYVTATYSNNKTQRIAQLATAKFASMGGLEKAGNSLYRSTVASGTATIGSADLQGSTLFTKSLEQSNVDMATQLVNMIKLQRAYSGNSKTITSSDEMMQETLALKR